MNPSTPQSSFRDTMSSLHSTDLSGIPTANEPMLSPFQQKKKRRTVTIVAAVFFVALLLAGIGVASTLVSQQTNIQKRASGGFPAPACGSQCVTSNDCQSGYVCNNNVCTTPVCTEYEPIYRLVKGSDHFYTGNLTERDSTINTLGYKAEGSIVFYASRSQLPGLKPVYRLNNKTEHFYTISSSELQTSLANGYTNEGVAFYASDATTTGFVPVYRVSSSQYHFYTISTAERDAALQSGYTHNDGVAFYVPSPIDSLAPVYRLAGTTDHFYTWSIAERDGAIANLGYKSEGIAFYAGTTNSVNSVSLKAVHRLNNGTEHFYTLDPTQLQSSLASGYKDEGVAFYASDVPVADFIPVYQLSDRLSVTTHFYTTSTAERDAAIANKNFTNIDGIAFYVPLSVVCDFSNCHLNTSTPTPTVTATPVANACNLTFTVSPPQTSLSCSKVAYRDESSNTAGNYTLLQQQSNFNPGDVVVFAITLSNTSAQQVTQISMSDVLTANNLNNVQFLDSNCGATAYNTSNQTLSCPAVSLNPGQTVTRIFRVRINSNVGGGTVITNTASATDGTNQTSCSVPVTVNTTSTATPTPSPTYVCGSSCTSDAQCQTANSGYVCASDYGNTCRMDSNRSSSSCSPAVNTYACNSSCTSNAQCQTVSSNYICFNGGCRLDSNPNDQSCQPVNYVPPTPQPGCNQLCSTNSDCASSDFVCATTSTGQRCRMANYINSETCTPPSVVIQQTTQAAPPMATALPGQPTKPKLPVTGSQDTLKFLFAGAGAIVLGAVALIML